MKPIAIINIIFLILTLLLKRITSVYNYRKKPIDLKQIFGSDPGLYKGGLKSDENDGSLLEISEAEERTRQRKSNRMKQNREKEHNVTIDRRSQRVSSLVASTREPNEHETDSEEHNKTIDYTNEELYPPINKITNLQETAYTPNIPKVLSKKKLDDDTIVGYWITDLLFRINIYNTTCDSVYDIYATYKFQHGQFSSIMFKASIAGTEDEGIGVSVYSETIEITETRVVLNCIDPDQKTSNPYACIIVLFHRPLNAKKKPVSHEFHFKFIGLGFLRRNPETLNNYFLFSIDNLKRKRPINNIDVELRIYADQNITNFFAKPTSFKWSYENDEENDMQYNLFKWHFQEVPGQHKQDYVGMFPEHFKTTKCRELNDIDLHRNNSFEFVQYLTWTIVLGFFGYLLVFIFVNEKEKYFLYRASEDSVLGRETDGDQEDEGLDRR